MCGKPSGVPLGRSLTLSKNKEIGFRQESDIGHDKEVSSGRNLILGFKKEVGFRQESDFGLGQRSRFRYRGHSDKPLETVIMGLCSLPCLFLNYSCLLPCLFFDLKLTLSFACI